MPAYPACWVRVLQTLGISTWAPLKSSLGPSHFSDPFYCYFCMRSFCGAFETLPMKKLSIILGVTSGFYCEPQQASAELCRKKWKFQKPEGHLSKGDARQSAVALVLWRTAGLTAFSWSGTTEFIFKENWTNLSHGAVNCKDCTKKLSVESLLFAGPHSGVLSLKDAALREDVSLISEQYKCFNSQAVVWLSVAHLVNLPKYQENCSSFWT